MKLYWAGIFKDRGTNEYKDICVCVLEREREKERERERERERRRQRICVIETK